MHSIIRNKSFRNPFRSSASNSPHTASTSSVNARGSLSQSGSLNESSERDKATDSTLVGSVEAVPVPAPVPLPLPVPVPLPVPGPPCSGAATGSASDPSVCTTGGGVAGAIALHVQHERSPAPADNSPAAAVALQFPTATPPAPAGNPTSTCAAPNVLQIARKLSHPASHSVCQLPSPVPEHVTEEGAEEGGSSSGGATARGDEPLTHAVLQPPLALHQS